MPSPLLDLFRPALDGAGDAPLIVRNGRIEATYGEVAETVGRLASALVAQGVRPGDRVSVQVEKSVDVLYLYLATLWAGAVFHPMNPGYSAEESSFLLGDAEPALALRSAGAVAELRGEAQALAEGMAEPVHRRVDDLAALLYTSGTTGRPKGAMITHGNLASNAAALVEAWGFRPNDVLLHVLPVFHAHGLFVACNTSLANGTSIVWHDRFDADAALDAIGGASNDPVRPTLFMGVPTHFTRLLAGDRLTTSLAGGMRLFISGSAPLQAATHEAFARRTGHWILERYGMTETQMITSNPLDGERVAGTVGYALPGVGVRVVAGDGTPVALDEVGAVEVRGPNVCAGYWRQRGRRTDDVTADGWFKTGDTGRLAADGRLTLVGRAKDLIISGGYNVYPAEVERVLDELPGVLESAVIGVPHPDFGEAGLAVVVPAAGGPEPEPARVVAALGERLATYKVPQLVVLADELPRNAMGKLQKEVLRARYAARWQEHLDG